MKKIERLTPGQEAELPKFRQKYLDIALDPKRIDYDKLASAIGDAYAHIGEKQPRLIVCDSPYRSMLTVRALEEQGLRLSDEELAEWVDVYIEELQDPDAEKRNLFVSSFLWGSQDMYWIAWGRFAEYIGVEFDAPTQKLLNIVERIGIEGEWWWPFKGVAIASQKPLETRWDDENRLHCQDGPAIRYADDWTLCAWHGVRIPRKWIFEKESLTAEIALRWENIEQRRAACELLGWNNIIQELDPVIIDRDPNPEIGTLMRVDLNEMGPTTFLQVLCATGRTFCLCVPPDMKTALQANAWTWGLSPSEYDPEVTA